MFTEKAVSSVRAMLVVSAFAAMFLCGIVDGATVVSYIDTVGPKEKMMVDGKPFFYIGEQTSFFRLPDWNWSELLNVFKTVKQDGFTVIGIVERWRDLEPTKNNFVWKDLDSALISCVKSGIKMEIIYFGHDVCTKVEGAPDWVRTGYQAVQTSNGSVVNSNDGFPKLDKTDTAMLAREQFLLTNMMNHIRSFLDANSYPNVVVGIQVLNEPTVIMDEDWGVATDRSYSPQAKKKWQDGNYTDATTFNADVMWEYLNGCSKAVKQSNYPVWTRTNWAGSGDGKAGREIAVCWKVIDKNEAARPNTYLDFIGDDPYTDDINIMFGYGKVFHKGQNFPMSMENGADFENTDQLIFNCMAGDAVYHVWEVHDCGLPGTCDFWGMYAVNANHTLSPHPWAASVRSMDLMLQKNWYNLASLQAGTDALRFYNRSFASSSTSAQTVGGYSISYVTSSGGGGIVSARSGDFVFLSSGQSTYNVPSTMPMTFLEKGYYDSSNTWVSQGTVTASTSGTQKTFPVGAYECVRWRTSATVAQMPVRSRAVMAARLSSVSVVNYVSPNGRVIMRSVPNRNAVSPDRMHPGVYMIQTVPGDTNGKSREGLISRIVVE